MDLSSRWLSNRQKEATSLLEALIRAPAGALADGDTVAFVAAIGDLACGPWPDLNGRERRRLKDDVGDLRIRFQRLQRQRAEDVEAAVRQGMVTEAADLHEALQTVLGDRKSWIAALSLTAKESTEIENEGVARDLPVLEMMDYVDFSHGILSQRERIECVLLGASFLRLTCHGALAAMVAELDVTLRIVAARAFASFARREELEDFDTSRVPPSFWWRKLQKQAFEKQSR